MAALGSRLIHNKRVSQPVAFGVGAALPPQLDLEAINVAKYALEHPDEDVEHETEAGQPATEPIDEAAPTTPMLDVSGTSVEHEQKRAEEDPSTESPKRARFADAGFKVVEEAFLLDDTAVGEQAPQNTQASDDDDDDKKRLQQVTSTDLSLYEHEDQPVKFSFHADELDELEEYDWNFHHDDFYDTDEMLDDDMSKQLNFPHSKFEAEVAEDELRRLDAIADSVEIKRLTGMQVLTNAADMPHDAKVLSTRFVRTWREKLDKKWTADMAQKITLCGA